MEEGYLYTLSLPYGQFDSPSPLCILGGAIMVLVGHGAVDHELVVPVLFGGLEGENTVCAVLSSWYAVPHLVAECDDCWFFESSE